MYFDRIFVRNCKFFCTILIIYLQVVLNLIAKYHRQPTSAPDWHDLSGEPVNSVTVPLSPPIQLAFVPLLTFHKVDTKEKFD